MTSLYSGNLLDDRNGRPIEGAELYVYDSATGVAATLTDIANQPIAQPLLTGVDGGFAYKAADGIYRHDFWKNSNKIYTDERVIVGVPGTISVATGAFGQTLVAAAAAANARASLAINSAAEIAASDGSTLVGFLQSGAGAVARTSQAKMSDVISVKDYGALGDGTAADVGFAAAQAAAIAAGKGRIIVPAGHYLLNNFDLSANNMIWEGDGDATRLAPTAINTNILTMSGSNVTLRGVKLEGNGRSTNSTNGVGVRLSGASAVMEDVLFDGLCWAVSGLTSSALVGPKIIRPRIRNTAKDTGVGGYGLFLGGAWNAITVEDIDALGTGSMDYVALIYNQTSSVWTAPRFRGGFVRTGKFGITCTDEDWDGSNRCFGLDVDGVHFDTFTDAAIKAKLSKGIRIRGNTILNCGGTPENAPSGLYGAVRINSIGQIDISHNTIRDSGDAAIVTNGNDGFPKSRPGDGYGLASIAIADNIIEGCGRTLATYGSAIVHLGTCKSINVHDNHVRDISRYGVYIDGSSVRGRHAVQYATVTGNTVIDSPTNAFYPLRVENTGALVTDNNTFANFKGASADLVNIGRWTSGAGDFFGDAAVDAAPCIQTTGVENISFSGAASCTYYDPRANTTAYALGIRRQTGGNVYEVVTAGTTGAVAPTGIDPTVKYTDGTVEWMWVGGYRKNAEGLRIVSGTLIAYITPAARFDYLVGPPLSGTPPGNLVMPHIVGGTATLAAGTVTVVLTKAEFDTGYKIDVQGVVGETYGVTGKTTSQFVITSSNAASTAVVAWRAWR